MDDKKLIEKYESGERNFKGANLVYANFSDANLRGAVLREADLSGANLCRANFGYANLSRANLWNANLRGANLRGTALWYADLRGANLSDANLNDANLGYANLLSTDFSEAKLICANLGNANLSKANLSGTALWYANLSDANLRGTILDPANEFDPLSEEEFLRAGFEVEVGRVVGYRTKRSVACGSTTYVPGKTYTAPVFSTDTETECHPGIYLAPLKWMKKVYPEKNLVKVSAKISDVLRCGDKWRARKIVVIEDYEEKENGQK